MSAQVKHTVELINFESLKWEGQLLFKNHSKIKNILVSRLGDRFTYFFATPGITDNAYNNRGKGYWLVEGLNAQAKKLSDLDITEQEVALQTYRGLIEELEVFLNELLLSGDSNGRLTANLIKAALEVPKIDDCLYFDGHNVCIVCWGFKYSDTYSKGGSVSKILNRDRPKTVIQELGTKLNNQLETPSNDNERISGSEKEEKENGSSTDVNYDKELKEDSFVPSDSKFNEKEVEEVEKFVDSLNLEDEKVELLSEPNSPKSGLSFMKILFLIFGGILIALIVFLFYKYLVSGNKNLPEKPGVYLPADSLSFGLIDSLPAVSNRANIIFNNVNVDYDKFADDLSQLFPNGDCQIIYYDTIIKHVQIQFKNYQYNEIEKILIKNLNQYDFTVSRELILNYELSLNDPSFGNPNQSYYFDNIKAKTAWNYSTGANDVVIAIIDDGFDLNHPELKAKVVNPFNIVTRTTNVFPALDSRTGAISPHGTHVAATAAGSVNNRFGISGIAPSCKVMPIQASERGGFTYTGIINSIYYAISHGAKVINLSLGFSLDPQANYIISMMDYQTQTKIIENLAQKTKYEQSLFQKVVDYANSKNVVIVKAAGNDGIMCGIDPYDRVKNIVCVAATNFRNGRASFSNYGKYTTISAPGEKIYNAIPDGKFDYLDGTSMASPIVAGAIGIIKSLNPVLTSSQMKSLLSNTGKPVFSAGKPMPNLLQLDNALELALNQRSSQPVVACKDAQKQIDNLLIEIEKIKQNCKHNKKNDTLKIPSNPSNLDFVKGKWRSTSEIVELRNNEPIKLYFDLESDGSGDLFWKNQNGVICSDYVRVYLKGGSLFIDQQSNEATCTDGDSFNPYYFVCKQALNGNASCVGYNKVDKSNVFKFNMVKQD